MLEAIFILWMLTVLLALVWLPFAIIRGIIRSTFK